MQSHRHRPNPVRHVLLGAALASSAALASLPAPAAPPGSPEITTTAPGTWQMHEYTFQYMGFTSTYSCDGLADKLKVLLLAAGARADLKSQPGVCAAGLGRPDRFAQAYLTFYTLAPVASSPAAAAEGSVPGTWRAVAFASRSPRELAVGDCEVVEQFRTSVLPMFSVRGIDNNTTCIPHQESGSVINLKFEVFAAAAKQSPPHSSAGPAPKGRAP